jgi:hypothetical protein
MILQLRHIFLTDAATFMIFSLTFSNAHIARDTSATQTLAGGLAAHPALKFAFFSSDSYC